MGNFPDRVMANQNDALSQETVQKFLEAALFNKTDELQALIVQHVALVSGQVRKIVCFSPSLKCA